MTGVPWELDQLPRQLHADPTAKDIFSSPPLRKQRARKAKDLPTINERPPQKSPLSQRIDAGRSSSDLNLNSERRNSPDIGIGIGSGAGVGGNSDANGTDRGFSPTTGSFGDSDDHHRSDGGPRKTKLQATVLGKMLSGLRR